MRLNTLRVVVPMLALAAIGLAQTPSPVLPPNESQEMVEVEVVRPDGTREVRLVPRTTEAPVETKAAPVLRPFHKGLRITRKVPTASPGSFVTASVADGSSGGSAPGSRSSGGGSSPVMGSQGDDNSTGSAWRPIGPRGGGVGDRPPSPKNLFTVDKQTGGGVLVRWFDPSTDTIESVVQRQSLDNQSNWGATREFHVGPTARSFDDKPGAGMHRYRVAGVNRAGASPFTNWGTVQIDESVPNAPSGLAITSMPPRISWADNSDNELQFEIEREKAAGSGWGSERTLSASADSTTLVDAPGTGVFRYRVRAVNGMGASSFTDWFPYTVQDTPPNAPSDLTLVGFDGGNQPRLSWSDNSPNEATFELERQKSFGGIWGSLSTRTFAADTNNIVDNPGLGTYRYRVRALNPTGSSAFTPYLVVTVADGLPSTPVNFSAKSSTANTASMTWQDTSNNETGFEAQREKLSGETWGQGATLKASANAASLADAPGVGMFRYRVRAVNSTGPSGYTDWQTVNLAYAPPGVPQSVVATDMGTRRALVKWSYEQGDATGFDIERSQAFPGGLVRVDSTVRGYVDQCGPGTFSYRVRTVGAGGESEFSPWASVTIAETYPAAPSELAVTDLGSQKKMKLAWHDNSTNEAGFRAQRQTKQGDGSWGTAVDLAGVDADVVQLFDTPPEGQHRYRVCATNSTGDSDWTPWVGAALSSGWTSLQPAADTRVYYVSSSEGSDANDGRSAQTPKKTVAAGYAMLRAGYPDWLLFKCGDVWHESFPNGPNGSPVGGSGWNKWGRSADEMMVISSYGEGARPKFMTGSSAALTCSGWSYARGNLAFVGLHFIADTWTGGSQVGPTGLWLYLFGDNYLIEDCRIEGYANNLLMHACQNAPDQRLRNVKIRRNVFLNPLRTDTGVTNIYLDGVDGFLLEENVIANQRSNDKSLLSQNVYITDTCALGGATVVGNIFYNGRTNLAERAGGLTANNLSIRGGQGLTFGYNSGKRDVSCTVYANVVTETRDHWDGQPLGQGIEADRVSSLDLSYNLVFGATDGHSPVALLTERVQSANIHHNVFYDWYNGGGECPLVIIAVAGNSGPFTFEANHAQQPVGSGKAPLWFTWCDGPIPQWFSSKNNCYYEETPALAYVAPNFAANMTTQQWMSREPSASRMPPSYPKVSVGTYNAELGGSPTTEAFIAEAIQQSRTYWRPDYTAGAANDYFRAKFGIVLPQ